MATKKFRLKGHETFTPREGWMSKGLIAVNENPRIFTQFAGADALGVGSNMAKSIRYWLKACKLTKDGKGETLLTDIGAYLVHVDKYLEDIFSLWILHINLVSNIELATTWYLFFNLCEDEIFQKEDLFYVLQQKMKELFIGETYSEKSLDSDISVLLHMYTREREKNYDPEDKKISPFSNLELIRKTSEGYKKVQPDLQKIDPLLILYVILRMHEGESISIDDLLEKVNGPGRIFNLNRIALNDLLEQLDHREYITLNKTAGLDMVYYDANMTPIEVLDNYYRQ